jgi:hypothetical protein
MSDFNSSLPVRTETAGDVIVKVGDGSTPSQQLSIDSSGKVIAKLNDGTGGVLESSTSAPAGTERGLIVRNIPSGTQAVSGTVAATQSGTWDVRLQDGAGTDVTSQVNGSQQALDVGINVAGVQVDPRAIRALTSSDVVSSNIRDATGTAFSVSNPLPVTFSPDPGGTEVISYQTNSAIAAAASSNHEYTVTALKTLLLKQVEASASSKAKIEIQVETGVGAGTYTTKAVLFNSTATPNMSIVFESPISVAAGVKVRVIRTNKDNQAQDLYSTILGQEI